MAQVNAGFTTNVIGMIDNPDHRSAFAYALAQRRGRAPFDFGKIEDRVALGQNIIVFLRSKRP
jgi:hypothetical protein